MTQFVVVRIADDGRASGIWRLAKDEVGGTTIRPLEATAAAKLVANAVKQAALRHLTRS